MKLQFRLRTLMLVVTVLAVPLGYVGWQAKIVRERLETARWIETLGGRIDFIDEWQFDGSPDAVAFEIYRPSLIRRLLGDKAFCGVTGYFSEADKDRIHKVFPSMQILAPFGATFGH